MTAEPVPQKKQRIWEIDAFRGLCILFVFASHFLFDLEAIFGLELSVPAAFRLLFQYGGTVFVLVSGLSATLGSRSFRRGLIVFACGMLITLVTFVMSRLGLLSSSDIIRFGVLHLLGLCMLLYPLLKKLPTAVLAALGAALIVLGYYFTTFYLSPAADPTAFDLRGWLFPLGLRLPSFSSGDYFPLLPYLGWFMEGIVLGRLVYADKRTRLPSFPAEAWPVRALRFVGRHSLEFYLLHQPVIFGVLELISLLR